ncbi:MAG: zinc ribbon domain-containing protein [Haloglomus sp.]
MGVSLWLVAALVVIPAVQVPLVLYLSQYVAVEESELPPVASGHSATPREWQPDDGNGDESGDAKTAASVDGALCARCGTENEPGYRFCRACAALL